MENNDEWLAVDKVEHLLACFLIALSLSLLLSRSRHPFLRSRCASIAAVTSLAAGAAKEAADEFGLFESAGASLKDAAADALGVVLALPFSMCIGRLDISRTRDRDRAISMV